MIRRTDVRTLDGLAGQLRIYVADRHGRVQQVTERSEPAGTDFASRLEDGDPILAPGRVSTYSEYDPAGRLIRVFTPLDSGPPYQERTFDYDGRGFLLAECHPEKGQGGGCVTYGGYDGLGNALGRVDGVPLADPMGNLAAEVYPRCDHAGCAGNDPSRAITSVFDQGLLVGVPGFAPRLTYHANGALATVDHANGVTDMVSIAADKMARPVEISAVRGGNTLWSTGAYTYDASGNVTAMGADQFWYDQVSRLTRADVVVDAATISETYSHDRFGNLLALAGATGTRSWSVDPRSNRVTTSGWAYDQSGNVTADPAGTFSWDALHALTAATGTGKNETYLYTAGDERVAVIDRHESPDRLRFSLRGLSGEVLRRYESQVAASAHGERWTWHQDYVYRGAALLASIKPSSTDPGGAVEHFHLDHLGTPRLKTNAAGQVASRHTYAPYGEELTAANLSSEAMRFTVHERDQDPAGWGNDLDYMHARFRSPVTGRFLSVDPVLGNSQNPQSWNRYTYTYGNPLRYVDPTGRYVTTCASDDKACAKEAEAFEASRQANLESSDDAIKAAAAAYGDPGVENGISVSFADPGKDIAGAVKAYTQWGEGGMGMVASVTIRPGMRGAELRAAVAHEGSHLLDAQAFIASFSADGRSWDTSKNLTSYQTEMNAYRLTHSIFKGSNEKFRQSCDGCNLGQGLRTPADVDLAIKRILADPAGHYKVNAEAPGPRQFDWP